MLDVLIAKLNMRITTLRKLCSAFLVISSLPTYIFATKYLLVELEQTDVPNSGVNEEPIENSQEYDTPPEGELEGGKINKTF